MTFIRGFLRNLAIIFGLGLVIYLIEPDMVMQVIEAFGLILGPIAFLFVIVAALPRRRGRGDKA
jgi:uncharacterized membrane protein